MGRMFQNGKKKMAIIDKYYCPHQNTEATICWTMFMRNLY